MTFTIIASGSSAKDWQPHGTCIGVNDAFKFGKAFHYLLICNRPDQFTKERMAIIKKTPHERFYCNKSNWSLIFPNWIKVNLVTFYGLIRRNQVYSANTSPFIAISLAYTLGATKIILWGVDFKNHSTFNESNPQTEREIETYLSLFKELKELGVEIFIGSLGSAFDNHLPLLPKYISENIGNPFEENYNDIEEAGKRIIDRLSKE
jgi:hypothetical protein